MNRTITIHHLRQSSTQAIIYNRIECANLNTDSIYIYIYSQTLFHIHLRINDRIHICLRRRRFDGEIWSTTDGTTIPYQQPSRDAHFMKGMLAHVILVVIIFVLVAFYEMECWHTMHLSEILHIPCNTIIHLEWNQTDIALVIVLGTHFWICDSVRLSVAITSAAGCQTLKWTWMGTWVDAW